MRAEELVSRILDDEGLTAGLNSDAAGKLVEWLVRGAEQIAAADPPDAAAQVEALCRGGRDVARRVAEACRDDPSADETMILEQMLTNS